MGTKVRSLADALTMVGYRRPIGLRSDLPQQAMTETVNEMVTVAGIDQAETFWKHFFLPKADSVARLIEAWQVPQLNRWQRTNVFKGDKEEAQGITHSSTNWYVSQRDRIWRRPRSETPGKIWAKKADAVYYLGEHTFDINHILDRYNHIGDIDFARGSVFAPVEFAGKEAPAAVLRLEPDLESSTALYGLIYRNPFTGQEAYQRQCGWVAINRDGLLFTGMSVGYLEGLDASGDMVLVYDLNDAPTQGSLPENQYLLLFAKTNALQAVHYPRFLGFFPLGAVTRINGTALFDRIFVPPKDLLRFPGYLYGRINGGVFNSKNQLLLAIGEDGGYKGRVACFSGFDGQFLGARVTGEGVSSDDPGARAESEGLTVWDFHRDGHEDIFVVTLENEWSESGEMVLQAYSEVQDPKRY